MEFIEAIFTILALYCMSDMAFSFWKRLNRPDGTRPVPLVGGRLPFVGHGIAFSRDVVGYIRRCYKTYGPIFQLKIFRTEIVVVCDRELTDEYFAKKEDDMSLYRVLERLYFADAFADDPNNLDVITRTVRNTIKINFDIFSPKIMEEGAAMVKKMKETARTQSRVNLQREVMKFITRTSSRCFISFEMTDEFFGILMAFSHLLNRIIVLTYFVPKWILRLIFNPPLRYYRKKMIKLIEPTIQSYRDNPAKNDSLVIRRAMDTKLPNGKMLTNKEIGEVLICLLYVSSENTALGLTSALVDLSNNPKYWEKIRRDSFESLQSNDFRKLFADRTIDACVMESARMNSHIFALNRQPMARTVTIGDYHVGNAVCVAVCEPMLMVHEAADIFDSARAYNPERFISGGEKTDSRSVMTWGSGVHLCPGKMFALYEIKAGLAMITNAFECPVVSNCKKNYFSPTAFAGCMIDDILMVPAADDCKEAMSNGQTTINIGGKSIVRFDTPDGFSGWLLPNYLTGEEQSELYNYTVGLPLSNESILAEIHTADPTKPYPFISDDVYTGTSNCISPASWYLIADRIWKFMWINVSEFSKMPELPVYSFYSQLFSEQSIQKLGKDEYVSWDININLGSSAEFIFGGHTIILHTGSVFITDFSKVEHGVARICPNTCPGWFAMEALGRCLMSIQIRSFSSMQKRPLSRSRA